MTIPIVALDVPTLDEALAIVGTLDRLCAFYKVGNELFTAQGPRVVEALRERGVDVFLDLKFHDIPNTVAGAVRSAVALGARLVNVHASGGRAMLEAAQAALGGSEKCQVLAVTVLTSMDSQALSAAWGRQGADVGAEVLRLAGVVAEAGMHGIVCSGQEVAAVRAVHGARLATLVPGVRLASSSTHDQARVITPAAAAAAGASYIVLGRTVTSDSDPRGAMQRVLSELAVTHSPVYS